MAKSGLPFILVASHKSTFMLHSKFAAFHKVEMTSQYNFLLSSLVRHPFDLSYAFLNVFERIFTIFSIRAIFS